MLRSSRLCYASGESALGWLTVAVDDRDLVCDVCFGDSCEQAEVELRTRHPAMLMVSSHSDAVHNALQRIVSYINDPSIRLDVRTSLTGTEKQKEVWRAIQRIPMGRTTTYSELATELGAPSSARAVAQACGANPLAVLVPCHRVIRDDGSLSGYRWGEERKRKLLEKERKAYQPRSSAFARGQGDVHVVPMSVIRRPMPSELDEGKVLSFMEEMKVYSSCSLVLS